MKKRIIFLFLIFSCLFSLPSISQEDEILRSRLSGKTRLDQIMPVIEQYYREGETVRRLSPETAARRLKKWKRWEWYVSSRLDMNGDFVNITQKNWDAAQSHARNTNRDDSVQIESTAGAWTFVGPNSTTSGLGRADRVVFHPNNAATIYVGTPGGGLWRTINSGASWTCITERIPSMGVSGIVINPNNPNEIFILTGDGDSDTGGLVDDFGYIRFSAGVLKCTDGGASGNWVKVGDFPGVTSTLTGYQLAMDPNNPQVLLAATSQGLFRTADGGTTWTLELTGRIYDVAYRPGNSAICYAARNNTFFRSIDGGLSWNNNPATDVLTAGSSRLRIAVSSANPSVVYVLCGGGNTPGQYNGLLRSNTSGAGFNLQSNQPCVLGRTSNGSDVPAQVTYDLCITIDPTNINRVIVGAIEAWRSTDGGVTWAYKGNGVHDDIHDLAYNPFTGTLWAASDGGMYSSVDDGDNWVDVTADMPTSQFYRISVSAADPLKILAGSQDNGTKYRSINSQNFEHLRSNDGYVAHFDPVDPNVFYGIMNSAIIKFDYGNTVNTVVNPANSSINFFSQMAMHYFNTGTFYVAEDTFWRTTNGGVTWNFFPDVEGGWFLRNCPSNSNRIYMAGGESYNSGSGILRRSDDGGVTWPLNFILSDNTNFPVTYPRITSINVDPTNSNRVYVTFGGFGNGPKVLYSTNAGGIWEDISGTLPPVPANTIAIDNNNNAYVGTDIGVFYRGAGMTDWTPYYNFLPYVPISDLVISESTNQIRAATFGRGVWQSDLHSACPANISLNFAMNGQKYYEASNTVNSAGSLVLDAGTKIAMQAGNEVRFTPPFTAPASTKLKASIAPCDGGGVPLFRLSDSTNTIPFRETLLVSDGRTAVPFATVETIRVQNDRASIKIKTKIAGTIRYVVTNEAGSILLRSGDFLSGELTEKNEDLSLRELPTGQYYVHVFHNDRWVHFQELALK